MNFAVIVACFLAAAQSACGMMIHPGPDGFPHLMVMRDGPVVERRPHHHHHKGGAARPNLAQLAEQLNLTTFVERLESSNVGNIINHEGSFI
jgi:hypothetical protein